LQEDRYAQAITDADQFKEKYPKSQYLSDVDGLRKDAVRGENNAKTLLAEAATNEKLARKLAKKDSVKTQPPSEKGNDNQKIPN